jgi:hypothetical protein
MAARTGASVGVAVTITILGLVAVAMFVTTMVFYGQAQRSRTDLEQAKSDYAAFVSDAQREHASVRAVLDEARRNNQSVVEHLMLARAELLKSSAGDQAMSMDAFREQIAGIEGADGLSLFALVNAKNEQIAQLTTRVEVAESERRAAQADAEAEAQRVADHREPPSETAANNSQIDVDGVFSQFKTADDRYRTIATKFAENLESAQSTFEGEKNRLVTANDRLQQENIALRDQVARLRGEGGQDRIMPLDEAALVDGTIDRVDSAVNEVVLSIGRNQKAILGMTFAVYSSPTDIREDETTGEYPEGKAVLEIVRVEDGFSRARVVRSSAGNPIIRGDVIANAAYDPKKTYKFMVEGLFDTNGDGRESRYERDELAALIERWGGTVVDEITGDLDFMVLGAKPVLPPAPAPQSPIAVINEYNRLGREIQRYEELQLAAEATSVPLLNANRLQTLIGDFPN